MPQEARIVVQNQKDGPLEIRELVLPDPGSTQVLVKMIASGVCQSQIFWMHQPRQNPVLFGHEGYGVVTGVGKSVTGIREGDYVLVTWVPRPAHDGRPVEVSTVALSDTVIARAPNVYTWADYTLVDELYVRTLGLRNHNELVSVVGCAVITGAGAVLNAARVNKENSVAVFGAGGVGLSAIAAARIVGAERIVGVDIASSKLDLARRFGATDVIDATREDPVAAIHKLLPGDCGCCSGVDFAFDCVGFSKTTTQALDSTRAGRLGVERGGTCVVVGVPKTPLEVDAFGLMMKEKTILGTVAGSCRQEHIDLFLDWYRDGLFDLEALVTDRYRFEDIAIAADDLSNGRVDGRAIVLM